MTQSKLTNMVKLITAIATALLLILICIIIYQYVKIGSLNSRSSALDKQIEQNSVTETELREGINRRSSDAYIEQQARESLGLVEEEGDNIYILS